jgi:hypothetical protein
MSTVGILIKIEVEDLYFFPSILEMHDFLELHDV